MKNISTLLLHLKSFDDNRSQHSKELRCASDRKEYAEIIAKCFTSCAQAILSGHFRVAYTSGGMEQVRKIYPLLNAAVAEEWPPLAHCLAALDAYLDDLTLFLLAEMSDKLALRAGNEAVSPELYAVCHA